METVRDNLESESLEAMLAVAPTKPKRTRRKKADAPAPEAVAEAPAAEAALIQVVSVDG